MRIREMALSAAFAAAIAVLAPASAQAQYYYSPLCNPFPLTWPFCVVGAVAYGVGAVVTAPFRAMAPRPYYYAPPYAPPPYYGPPANAYGAPPPGAPPEAAAPPAQ
ncbi:MAG TPA: hypothetical protein VME41_02155 [Stellaceae bacterium]|nr:hypothetical protein [Stellaceae bacterium]